MTASVDRTPGWVPRAALITTLLALAPAAASASTTVLAAGAGAIRSVEHRLSTVDRAEIQVFLAGGRLDVRAAEAPEIVLSGSLGAGLEGIEVHHAGRFSRLRVEPANRRPTGDPASRRAELVLTVPAASDLRIDGASSSVTIDGLRGRLEILSLDGNVSVSGSPRSVTIGTVSGAIHVDIVTPRLEASSVSGDMVLDGTIESLRADSVEGTLDIAARVALEAQVATVTSELLWRGELGEHLRLHAETGSGGMRFELDPDLDAVVDIEGLRGGLVNALGPSVDPGSQRRHLRFRTGLAEPHPATEGDETLFEDVDGAPLSGSPSLRLRSLGGPIRLHARP